MDDNDSILLSVVIPYYNPKFEYFLEAIQSILDQSYTNWEVVIVNDGSSLESKNVLCEYINKLNNKRFSIISHKKNCGVSVAKNTGIKLAKGELITFLDPDDFLLSWDFEQIINTFRKNPDCLILSADYLYYLQFGPVKKICTNKIFNKIILPRLVLKSEVFNILRFDSKLRRGEDTDLLIQILNNKNLLEKLTLSKETGYVYRFYPSRERLTHNLHFRLNTWEILKNKYKNEESDLVKNMIRNIESSIFEIKYYTLVRDYLTHGSVIKLLKEIFNNYKTIKEKIKCLIALTKVIIEEKCLLPLFGINLKFIDILINLKNNFKKVEDADFILSRIRKVTT